MNNFNGILNLTIIETDLDGNLLNNSEAPFWLTDIMEQAFSASGIRARRKVASKDAIASLEEVNASEISDESCPICYEPYKSVQNKKLKVDERLQEDSPAATLNRQLDRLQEYGVDVATPATAVQFQDPSIFMPVDLAGHAPVRFPQNNLYSRENVTENQMFPTIVKKLLVADANCDHTPVRMPHCHHIFGKPCIIEWLNGNVSCPLCRKEVDAVRSRDSKQIKVDHIRETCRFQHSENTEEAVAHLAEGLTDVFNPYRRPFNPSITPLTDSPVTQVWATPNYPDYMSPTPASNPDPPLTMARSFPLSVLGQLTSSRRTMPFGSNLFGFGPTREPPATTNTSLQD